LESSDEEEEVPRPRQSQSRKQQPTASLLKGRGQPKAWIKGEGSEDDPVNFMDPVVVQRILGEQVTH
jgi:hypothetical protein